MKVAEKLPLISEITGCSS